MGVGNFLLPCTCIRYDHSVKALKFVKVVPRSSNLMENILQDIGLEK